MTTQQPPGSKNRSITPIPMQDRIPKRWLEAKRKYGRTQNQLQNETVESAFHQLLYKTKQLIKQQPGGTYFERDYRYDASENAFTLHAFMSSSIYLYIECSFDYVYRIEYAFNSCPYEAEIRKLLTAYIFTERAKEVELKPTFTQFYQKVLEVQDKQHIHSL